MNRRNAIKAGLAVSSFPLATACGGGGSNQTALPFLPPPPSQPPTRATELKVKAEKNVAIPVRDGKVVIADIFRPDVPDSDSSKFPVLITMGAYSKDLPFKEYQPRYWPQEMNSGEGDQDYMVWEVPLPDYWVPHGYVHVRCDQPGSGQTPGDLDVWGPDFQLAYYDAIEWAGTQSWSNGKVGILGTSYYAVGQWLVAQHQPPHLAAICPMHGFTDCYRDLVRHGGIFSSFVDTWYPSIVEQQQHGSPSGKSITKLSREELAANTAFPEQMNVMLRRDSLRFATDAYYTQRTPDMKKVTVPIYSCANQDAFALHMRGTIEGFLRAEAAPYRRLKVYTGVEPSPLYTRKTADEQRRFFDRFLKGEMNGFDTEPRVLVTIKKNGVPFAERTGQRYPLEGTFPQKLFLECSSKMLKTTAPAVPANVAYRSEYGLASGVLRFTTEPLEADLELIGPMRLHLTLSTDKSDADLFVAVREIRADGTEPVSTSARGDNIAIPIAVGWLRASMRASEEGHSTVYRTWHSYDKEMPLSPGVPVTLDVNIWPAASIVQKGSTFVVEIGGTDLSGTQAFPRHPAKGPYAVDGAPLDNEAPPACNVTLYSGGTDPSFLLMPVYGASVI